MARKPRVRKVVTVHESDEEEEQYTPPLVIDPAEESYAAFVGKFSQEDVIVKVQRETPTGREYCFRGTPSEIDDETIRLYHAKQPYAHEVGKYSLQVFVHGEPRNAFPVHIAPQIATPGTEKESGGFTQRDFMLDFFQKQNERLERQLERLQERPQNQEPIGALADAMLKLRTLQGEQGPSVSLDTIMKAVELGRTLNPNGETDWKPLLLEVVKDAMPTLQGLLGALATRNGGGGNPEQIAGGDVNEEAALRGVFQFLKKKCLAGSDPGLYIDVVVDNRDDPTYQKLIAAVRSRDFSAFTAIDAEVGKEPFLSFFRFIYDGLRRAFSGQNQVGADTGGESGNSGNAGEDEDPGPVSVKK